ncbi:hypothetical protein RDABS01_034360 [Bienertia sinuspersici]
MQQNNLQAARGCQAAAQSAGEAGGERVSAAVAVNGRLTPGSRNSRKMVGSWMEERRMGLGVSTFLESNGGGTNGLQISQVILDEAFFDGILNGKLNTSVFGGSASLEYLIVIYRILLTHRGCPLHKFVLRFPEWIVKDTDVVYDWIWGATLHYDFIPPKNDLTQLEQLKHLHLVEAPLNLSTTLSFINRWLFDTSPRLEQLYVEVAVDNDRDVADEFGIDGSCILKSLKNVQIVNVSGLKNELQLIKLILSSSPMLREMRIEFETKLVAAEDRYRFSKESSKYTRSSPHDKVIFQEKN